MTQLLWIILSYATLLNLYRNSKHYYNRFIWTIHFVYSTLLFILGINILKSYYYIFMKWTIIVSDFWINMYISYVNNLHVYSEPLWFFYDLLMTGFDGLLWSSHLAFGQVFVMVFYDHMIGFLESKDLLVYSPHFRFLYGPY